MRYKLLLTIMIIACNIQAMPSSAISTNPYATCSQEDKRAINDAATNQQQIIAEIVQQTTNSHPAAKMAMTEKNNLLIFVSFSMSDTSLRQWLIQASKVGARLVLRGFKNNSLKDTTAAIHKIITDATDNHQLHPNSKGFEINPELFTKFNVNRVPAVVLTEKTNLYKLKAFNKQINHDIVFGNTGLRAALDKIQGANTQNSNAALILLQKAASI